MKAFVTCAVALSILLGACRKSMEAHGQDRSADATAIADAPECSPMTPIQARRAAVALQVLGDFPRYSAIYGGAMDVFGAPVDIVEGARPGCLSEQIKQRVTAATLKAGVWRYGLASWSRLMLARRLGPRDPTIVADVAQAAFYAKPIADGAFADIRPQARSVLASFGVAARPWKTRALASMSDKDALGTSAAQVAAASKDPRAVAAVARLLGHALHFAPGRPIPRDNAKRAVELAYAVGASADAGRAYVGLLLTLLRRDVQSLAPPFGVIRRKPNEVCRALQAVGGAIAERAVQSPACKPPLSLLPG